MLQKDVMPFEYIDSLENIEYPKRCIQGYKDFETFEFRNLGQYTDLYMKTDILLLAI